MSGIRHAFRTLTRQPGATAVVVLTIAVAIAATTVIYSAIDLVWTFIPIRNTDRLAYITSTDTRVLQADDTNQSVVLRSRVSMPDFADWSARSSSFEQLTAFEMGSVTLTGADIPLRLSSVNVTWNLIDVWGYTPVLGRPFRAEDAHAGATPVALLTSGFWQRQYSSRPTVLGTTVLLDGVAHTIVGVLPSAASGGVLRDSDVFLPLGVDALRGERGRRSLLVTGRLKPNVTRAQAHTEIEGIARQLRDEHPDTNRAIGASVLPIIEASGFNVRILLSILALIALLVLVVACANVSGVIVAQSIGRRHELAVRAALGASRFDRVRQLMIESTLASALACIIGLMLAAWGISALRWLGGNSFGLAGISLNWRAVFVGVAAAFVAPLGFGLLPALRASAPDPEELRDGARGVTRRGRRIRNWMVALQAGAAMILMVQIGLLVRTTWALSEIAPGFDPARVLTFRVALPESQYGDAAAVGRFREQLLTQLGALPGVASVGAIDYLPVADSEPLARLTVEGAPPVPLDSRPTLARTAIAGDYLEAMRIPLRQGRTFTRSEMNDGAPVAVVSEEAARRFWPGRNPLGARLALDAKAGAEGWLEIVGVVGNARSADVDQGPLPQVFVPASTRPGGQMAVVIKSAGPDALQLVPAVRAEVARIDRNQPIHDVALMTQVLFDDLAGTYVLAALLTAVGVIALCVAAAGVYGLVSSSVAQRGREIGVRMALGARPGVVVRMVLASGARPVAAGALVGLIAAVVLAVGIGMSIPGVDARDPANYAAVALTIAAVAFLASYLPARRAARIDPLLALRQE
jgi:putative ABC transport system permease protein